MVTAAIIIIMAIMLVQLVTHGFCLNVIKTFIVKTKVGRIPIWTDCDFFTNIRALLYTCVNALTDMLFID